MDDKQCESTSFLSPCFQSTAHSSVHAIREHLSHLPHRQASKNGNNFSFCHPGRYPRKAATRTTVTSAGGLANSSAPWMRQLQTSRGPLKVSHVYMYRVLHGMEGAVAPGGQTSTGFFITKKQQFPLRPNTLMDSIEYVCESDFF